MQTRVLEIDPRKLKLAERNARFMRHETFMRLVKNIKNDGELTQLPFCVLVGFFTLEDEIVQDEDGQPVYEVLSGNHRVRAALAAGLEVIKVQVTDEPIARDRRRAIQLSHNAVVGEDDPTILKTIYESIEEPDLRLYTGLDDRQLDLLADVSPDSIAEAGLLFQNVSMTFFPSELEEARRIWDDVRHELAGSKEVWINRWAEYDRTMDALETAGYSYDIRNTGTCMMVLLELVDRHMTELAEGWLDSEGNALKRRNGVPIETVLGDRMLPSPLAARLRKAIARMLSERVITKDNLWNSLGLLLDVFEGA